MGGNDGVLVKVEPMLARTGRWQRYQVAGTDRGIGQKMRRHERTRHPIGSREFLKRAEGLLGPDLLPNKPAPKPDPKRS